MPVGFFDSGLGGLSVLQEALQIMPDEKYIYYGDSLNAPYGEESAEEVRSLTIKNVEFLIEKGVKALVIACNTATSVAIDDLRNMLEMPVIGMEPAIKPAAMTKRNGDILLLATKMTLKEDKLKNLIVGLNINDHLIKVAAPEMVTLIENGEFSKDRATMTVKKYLDNIALDKINSIVLGCTHFVFYRNIIAELVNENVTIIDGNKGTVKHLYNRLRELDLLANKSLQAQDVKYYNSDSKINSSRYKQILKKLENINN